MKNIQIRVDKEFKDMLKNEAKNLGVSIPALTRIKVKTIKQGKVDSIWQFNFKV